MLVGFSSANATSVNDSPFVAGNSNYANLNEKVTCAAGDNPEGDGICDTWKKSSGLQVNFVDPVSGVSYQYTLLCDPQATYQSDPTGSTVCPMIGTKDVYIELDWMTNQGPVTQAVSDVVQAYLNQGIHLHVQYGETWSLTNTQSNSGDIQKHYCDIRISNPTHRNVLPQNTNGCSTSTGYQDYLKLKQTFFGTIDERNINSPNYSTFCPGGETSNQCLTAKRQAFHYVTYNFNQYGNHASSGWAEIPGNDVVISLGSFTNGVGSIDEQEGAFMHELGHNLGLYHGGNLPSSNIQDDSNCKPNYLSVMSYTYEFGENADVCRPLDYSNNALNTLSQTNLVDSAVGSYTYQPNSPTPPGGNTTCQPKVGMERPIWFSDQNSVVQSNTTGNVSPDWNSLDIYPNNTPWSQTLNNLGIRGCNTQTTVDLNGFNDWDLIKNGNIPGTQLPIINFRESSNFNGGIVPMNTSSVSATNVQSTVVSHLPVVLKDTVEGTGDAADSEITIDAVQQLRADKINNLSSELHDIYKIKGQSTEYLDSVLNHTLQSNMQNDSKTLWSVVDDLNSVKAKLQQDSVINDINQSEQKKVYGMINDASATFATAATVPEFGHMAVIILLASLTSILIFTRLKTRLSIF